MLPQSLFSTTAEKRALRAFLVCCDADSPELVCTSLEEVPQWLLKGNAWLSCVEEENAY